MTSPAAAALKIEAKVAGVAVNDLAKTDGGAASPGQRRPHGRGAIAAKTANRKVKKNFMTELKKSNPVQPVRSLDLSGAATLVDSAIRPGERGHFVLTKICLRSLRAIFSMTSCQFPRGQRLIFPHSRQSGSRAARKSPHRLLNAAGRRAVAGPPSGAQAKALGAPL